MPAEFNTALIDSAELATFIGVSQNTIKRWSRNGVMPKGRRVGPRLLKWSRVEIEDWINGGCERTHAPQAQAEACH